MKAIEVTGKKKTITFGKVPLNGFFIISGGLYRKLKNINADTGNSVNERTTPAFGAFICAIKGVDLDFISAGTGEGYAFQDTNLVDLVEVEEIKYSLTN